MISKKIKKIIVKYLTNEATSTELDTLTLWLDNPKNETLFNDFVKVNYAINYNMKAYDSKTTELQVLKFINKDKRTKRLAKRKASFLKYAALILVFLALGYGYLELYSNKNDKLVFPTEVITLKLDNGKTKTIDDNDSNDIVDDEGHIIGIQSGKKIEYFTQEKKSVLVYNTLTVPYGKKFEIKLADGTIVNLNAGSSLKYPVNFVEGKHRNVFLEGEAFFKVAKDAKHPFVVNANEIDVRVLGTEFNISSYSEDENINTVLVEGSVSVYKANAVYNVENSTLLKPGYKAAWSKVDRKIQVSKADVESHLAWLNGRLILKEVEFKAILKKLERQYNVKFINHNKSLENRFFTAKFDNEDIDQVMESLSYSGNFTYKFNKDTIIINSKKK
ncbi:FecR family protein [Winogradskyella sp. SM1960]|uniref:FecR family protein n=1 Tax=Winogradskyella sp. SM1960 TaxID=2865955 RepID=UPI001CD21347|nr:FecR family protein [Winogradskyella sp. SM1960]